MKRACLLLCLPFVSLFFSCSTKVDLYAGYQEKPVIYGLLDARADTNFIKITRAFYVKGDAHQIALNPDSSNYPGKLDARLVEYSNGDSVREIILDTITIHNKEQGVFYAPSQKLYYTTEPLPNNSTTEKYSYKLKVALPDRLLTTRAELVGNDTYGVQSLAVNFSKEYFHAVPREFLFRPAINAGFYEVNMTFTFLEQRTPDGDSVPRTMRWYIGRLNEYELSHDMDFNCYKFYYRPEDYYAKLAELLGSDTAIVGLQRFIGDYPVEVIITAGGDELGQYIHNNNSSLGFSQGDNEFSLIDGGYGVFSSRMTARRLVRLGGSTVPELVAKRNWGFKFIGGREDN